MEMIIILFALLLLSIGTNILLFIYARNLVRKLFFASEAASEIFVRFVAYKKHLQQIYELKLFYGDRNLKEVVEHTTEILSFLEQFKDIYSFTQPELEEILISEQEDDDAQGSEKI